jgi:hypothetical protein
VLQEFHIQSTRQSRTLKKIDQHDQSSQLTPSSLEKSLRAFGFGRVPHFPDLGKIRRSRCLRLVLVPALPSAENVLTMIGNGSRNRGHHNHGETTLAHKRGLPGSGHFLTNSGELCLSPKNADKLHDSTNHMVDWASSAQRFGQQKPAWPGRCLAQKSPAPAISNSNHTVSPAITPARAAMSPSEQLLHSWNKLNATQPDFGRDLIAAVEADHADG